MANILLVEDEEILRDAYSMILRSADINVDVAKDGLEALKLWEKDKYDIVFLDLMMPRLDGIGFLKKVKIAENPSDTKIIVFTNLSSGGNIQEALALGADEFILKSDLSPQDLLGMVRETVLVD